MLRDVGSAIAGRLDQVVFSNRQLNGRAGAVVAVTPEYRKTFQSLAAQRTDPNYFRNNMKTVNATVWIPNFQCVGFYSRYDRNCFINWRYYRVRLTGYDSRVISSSAVAAKNIIDSIQSGSRAPGEGGSAIGKILAKVLGAVVGGLC